MNDVQLASQVATDIATQLRRTICKINEVMGSLPANPAHMAEYHHEALELQNISLQQSDQIQKLRRINLRLDYQITSEVNSAIEAYKVYSDTLKAFCNATA